MSPTDDRVAVPTNGHQPAMSDRTEDTGPATAGTERGTASVPAVSPGQFAAGFGIIAAVILLVLRRRRSRRD